MWRVVSHLPVMRRSSSISLLGVAAFFDVGEPASFWRKQNLASQLYFAVISDETFRQIRLSRHLPGFDLDGAPRKANDGEERF